MNPQERQIIDQLFDKLGQAEQQASPREPVAEAHIRSRIDKQPGAPYLMAQTIVVQEQALNAAQTRLAALEDELTRRPASGGFLSGLFGNGASQRAPNDTPDRPHRSDTVPSSNATRAGLSGRGMATGQAGRGGGFLAGAAQTAMGVAGGMLLGSMIGSAFGGGEAQAAPAAEPEPSAADEAQDDGADFGGDDM